MKKLIILLLLISCQAKAQKVYQTAEVDAQAEPAGGPALLNLFLSSNLRIPIKSAWNGIDSRVFVKAIIETDGSASNFQVIRGIDTLCNQEAIRVMNLYKVWKPALVKDMPVRQELVISVPFNSPGVPEYDSTLKSIVVYYDKNWRRTLDVTRYRFRRSVPVDEFGYINGNVIYQKGNKDSWEEDASVLPLEKEESWQITDNADKRDSIKVIKLSVTIPHPSRAVYQTLVKQLNGTILEHEEFSDEGQSVFSKSYHANAVLKELEINKGDTRHQIHWYSNGQLANIVESPFLYKNPMVYTMRESYDKKGRHVISNGNGYFSPEMYPQHGFEGQGKIEGGLKEGLWTFMSKDSTFRFEEQYEKGVLSKGISFSKGERREYNEVEVQPEFAGGSPEMYKYLSKNIRYPKSSAKNNIQGMVFTSFVVCEDGTLCDFKIIKGLDKSIDREALRVVEGMSGKWKPGLQRGRKVRVKYNLPINFVLQ